jgi:flagellar motor switch protein FliN/FliY
MADKGPDANVALRQDEIEKLFANSAAGGPSSPADDAVESVKPDAVSAGSLNQGDVEFLLNRAEEALKSIDAQGDDLPTGVMAFQFQELGGSPPSADSATLDLISEVELDLKIELGRTHMYLEDVLRLRRGAVVPLDKLAGDPVDIFVNDRLIARGEVLVLNDNFCVRVAELVAGATFE